MWTDAFTSINVNIVLISATSHPSIFNIDVCEGIAFQLEMSVDGSTAKTLATPSLCQIWDSNDGSTNKSWGQMQV